MNKRLKFSWGHIIAFLALIAIGYISFVGCTYLTNGQFLKAFIVMAICVVALFVVFMGMQMAKSTAHKFSRWIWVERILLLISPIVFITALIPYSHFWTVRSHNDEVVEKFSNAIKASKQMFVDYDDYANERIGNYDYMLGQVITEKDSKPKDFASCGFFNGREHLQRENMVKTLRLQLLSCNYDSLKTEALLWIDESCEGANTWNVFLIGNIREIKEAIHGWNKQLAEYSTNKLSNEETFGLVANFSETSKSLESMDKKLESLTDIFQNWQSPSLLSIIIAILLYFALLFPYILQDRHTKSGYVLLGTKKGFSDNGGIEIRPQYAKKSSPSSTNEYESTKQDDDDYASFTI